MKTGELVYLVVAAVIAVAGVALTIRSSGSVRHPRPSERWTHLGAALQAAFGRVGAFYVVVAFGAAPIIFTTWLLGSWTRHKPLTTINEHVLQDYYTGRTPWLTSAMKVLTQMGNWYQIVTVAVVASVGYALIAKSRRWVPALIILSTLLGERYIQKVITAVVKLHHPPTDLGTYPSGGVARLVCIYGIVAVIGLRLLWSGSRRARVGAFWLLAFLTWTEGYSRIHLQKHWMFDTVGGLILGAGVLTTAVIASRLLPAPAGRRSHPVAASAEEPRPEMPMAQPVGSTR